MLTGTCQPDQKKQLAELASCGCKRREDMYPFRVMTNGRLTSREHQTKPHLNSNYISSGHAPYIGQYRGEHEHFTTYALPG